MSNTARGPKCGDCDEAAFCGKDGYYFILSMHLVLLFWNLAQ